MRLPNSTSNAVVSEAQQPHFVLIAGEASGDQLGAGLLRELRTRFPTAEFSGIGGPQMQAEGMAIWEPMESLSVMGLSEVLKHLPRLLRLRKSLRERIIGVNPICFIGIDAPDFNLPLARMLKSHGIRTVHYVSPSIWAWREQRAAKIARSADLVLCLFPMEPPIYQRFGVNAVFVGHPVADRIPLHSTSHEARKTLRLDVQAESKVLCLMPGSRRGEIDRLGVLFIQTALTLQREFPSLKIVMPSANARSHSQLHGLLSQHDATNRIRLTEGQSHLCMQAADLILLASGTAALEAMLVKRPMVVAYKVSKMTYAIVKLFRMMKTTRYSLPNILANADVVPELMQNDATQENLLKALRPHLQDTDAFAATREVFTRIHHALRGNADVQAADAIQRLLESGVNPSPVPSSH